MFSQFNVKSPSKWHLALSHDGSTVLERGIGIFFFAGLTALCAQLALPATWTPVPYTFQTFSIMAAGVYLRRNDAFLSGAVYLLAGAVGAPVFAGGASGLFSGSALIASAGYLFAFPFASALIAEGLDRSRKAGFADLKAQILYWSLAMIPVYIFGTLWLAEALSLDLSVAFDLGTKPFLLWDFGKIVLLAFVTTKVWSYEPFEGELDEEVDTIE
jgi:biotin transport system substrate-specific component|tara:strand:+ start:119 stop:763 length:645 start_codon:yes stop_codon:yes gene_type:complete